MSLMVHAYGDLIVGLDVCMYVGVWRNPGKKEKVGGYREKSTMKRFRSEGITEYSLCVCVCV